MANTVDRAVIGQLQVLFGAGVISEWSDAELLSCFAARRDADAEIAFEVLVRRHGPMVLRVCRAALGDAHDAQDAFQATFLVLARKAGSIHRGDSLASWLHEVARRVAWRARAESSRHRVLQRIGAELTAARQVSAVAQPSLELHDELSRLPEKYRSPLVLCYLEGLTHEEAASRLGWPIGTVRSRLARGRDALRIRLNSGGVAAPAAVLTLASGAGVWAETVPTTLTYSTIRAVMAPITATSNAITLMKGTIATMTRTQLIKAVTLALSAGLIGAGATLAYSPVVAIDDPPKARSGTAESPNDNIQGVWILASTETGGRVEKARPQKPYRLVVREDVFDFGGDGESRQSFVLHPAKTPAGIDLTPQDDVGRPIVEKTCFGIYKVEGDTLTLCLQSGRSGIRPADFSTKPDDGRVLDVFRRESRKGGQAGEDPVKADLDKLQGKWFRVASEADGRDWMPKGIVDPTSAGLMVIFEGDKWRGVGADGTTIETHHTITLKPTKTPEQMILGFNDGTRKGAYKCIYKIKDDTLTLCIQFNTAEDAPTDFTTKPGDGRVLDVYKRAKAGR